MFNTEVNIFVLQVHLICNVKMSVSQIVHIFAVNGQKTADQQQQVCKFWKEKKLNTVFSRPVVNF